MAADGRRTGRSARRSGCTTTRWRCGDAAMPIGVAGLVDEERPGRPPVYGHDDVLLLVKTVTEPPPNAATRWTMDAIAGRLNEHGVAISASQVWRICRSLDLKPWQTESWMTSHDPEFWAKAADVCGLYLTRPTTPWCGRSTRSPGCKPAAGSTRPARPSRGAGATRVRVPPPRHRRVVRRPRTCAAATSQAWVTDSTRTDNFVEFLADLDAPDTGRDAVALHRRQPLGALHREVEAFLEGVRTSSCTTPRPTPRGSTKSSCSSPSSSGACCATASSTPSSTRRSDHRVHQRLQPSGPSHSAGPTTATHSRSRKLTMTYAVVRQVRPPHHALFVLIAVTPKRKGRPELAGQASGSSSRQSCPVTRPDTARHCRPVCVCVCPTCSELGREHRPTRETSRRPGSPGHLVRMRPAADSWAGPAPPR